MGLLAVMVIFVLFLQNYQRPHMEWVKNEVITSYTSSYCKPLACRSYVYHHHIAYYIGHHQGPFMSLSLRQLHETLE